MSRPLVHVAVTDEEYQIYVAHLSALNASWRGFLDEGRQRGVDVTDARVCCHIEPAFRRILAQLAEPEHPGHFVHLGLHPVEVTLMERAGLPIPDLAADSAEVWHLFDQPDVGWDPYAIVEHARTCRAVREDRPLVSVLRIADHHALAARVLAPPGAWS